MNSRSGTSPSPFTECNLMCSHRPMKFPDREPPYTFLREVLSPYGQIKSLASPFPCRQNHKSLISVGRRWASTERPRYSWTPTIVPRRRQRIFIARCAFCLTSALCISHNIYWSPLIAIQSFDDGRGPINVNVRKPKAERKADELAASKKRAGKCDLMAGGFGLFEY